MIPIRYNLRSIVVRRVGTAMTILGVALTVSVFVSILAMIQGLQNTFVETGDPLNLIMMRKGSTSEVYSFFNRDVKGIVETIEGVDSVSGEVLVLINSPRITGEPTNIIVRGVSDKSLALRPQVKIAQGRMFRPGVRE
ncbi:MAG TPA: ABC transporter permease, partial [Terriglobia bacterium]|nr:ABC transporter permease [Terriglobia bacterium]